MACVGRLDRDLVVAVAQDMGITVGYLPGLSMEPVQWFV